MRYRYKSTSRAGFIELAAEHVMTGDEFVQCLRAVEGVTNVRQQKSKSEQQGRPGCHELEHNLLVESDRFSGRSIEFGFTRHDHMKGAHHPRTVTACFKVPPRDLLVEAWLILLSVACDKELEPHRAWSYAYEQVVGKLGGRLPVDRPLSLDEFARCIRQARLSDMLRSDGDGGHEPGFASNMQMQSSVGPESQLSSSSGQGACLSWESSVSVITSADSGVERSSGGGVTSTDVTSDICFPAALDRGSRATVSGIRSVSIASKETVRCIGTDSSSDLLHSDGVGCLEPGVASNMSTQPFTGPELQSPNLSWQTLSSESSLSVVTGAVADGSSHLSGRARSTGEGLHSVSSSVSLSSHPPVGLHPSHSAISHDWFVPAFERGRFSSPSDTGSVHLSRSGASNFQPSRMQNSSRRVEHLSGRSILHPPAPVLLNLVEPDIAISQNPPLRIDVQTVSGLRVQIDSRVPAARIFVRID